MRKFLLTSGVCLISAVGFSQLRVGFESNSQYYIDDNKIKLDTEEAKHRFRSNNYLKIDYRVKNFEFGIQGESYAPKALLQYNPQLKDYHIGTAFARYNNTQKGIDITVGHFYEQFGSGLALRLWEDRALGINNALFGGRIKWNLQDIFQLKVLGGRQRIGMGFDFSKGFVLGSDAELDISQLLKKEDYTLKVGGSFTMRNEDITKEQPQSEKNTSVFGFRTDYSGEKFNFSGEYLYKTKDIHFEQNQFFSKVNRPGNALLINMGYNNNDNIAFNINLRRLENFRFFSQRNIADNIYNYGVINYIPALTKQYEHSLQNIYVYQAQPQIVYDGFPKKQGEIGGQFDLFYEAEAGSFLGGATGASFAINGSYWAGIKNDIKTTTRKDKYGVEIEEIELNTPLIGMGEKYYHDIAIEYRKSFTDNFTTVFSYLNQYYNSLPIVQKSYIVKAHTISAEGMYFLSDTQSVRLEMQHQWANEDLKNWIGNTLEYIPNVRWSFFVSDLYNYGNDEKDKRIHYYNVGTSFSYKTTRVALSYGRQRGGILCVGGICRIVPEAAGLTLNITSSF
ncbi:conserved exported hypothetical protein [Capnocytophaga canimorsus]|uniref:Uncharacterized protein n=1 Tax=Capnocytophaga canimorsus TaxID=28188 RepID=A0A0B7HAM7_9FLAO|nr:DUF6029 family protein [Capnocytophaga canimorsus]ATA76537.1 hypothetical protein CGC47_02505 [Capnocytophaga canimorsus]PJI77299.1 hypothetical protein CLV61_1627 [Capnocytophaga canimorsus]CEN35594.1 conserved exported hypothetical protein [Capnocytophaga canimorsus]STA71696.1 Uncharacterised protein [Capnocytophaga canimorsus]